jgi:hypothetical protein
MSGLGAWRFGSVVSLNRLLKTVKTVILRNRRRS